MAKKAITFYYYPGVFGDAFPGIRAQLLGSWDDQGQYADQWSGQIMRKVPSEDGGFRYEATVNLDDTQRGREFNWGVQFIENEYVRWAVATEVNSDQSVEQYRTFIFDGSPSVQKYYLTTARYLGANKYRKDEGSWGAKFRVWAPNARRVELVFGSLCDLNDPDRRPVSPLTSLPRERLACGYIAADGSGIHPDLPVIQMNMIENGVWETPDDHPDLQDTSLINHRLYMFRVERDDGSTVYRTDLYSRCQSGFGKFDPEGNIYTGALAELSGRVSCSVTVDPERVVQSFMVPDWPEPQNEFIDTDQFWHNEFSDKVVPNRIEDLIIYELHLGALGFGKDGHGTLEDAIQFLDHVEQLNINAIELLPVSEASGDAESWGYATSHYFAVEYSGGGRDQFKHFIKACHQRGIAVIMDVVYNHYDHHADRAERYYDSPLPEKDIYFWYEGNSDDYRYLEPYWGRDWYRGGYLENQSSGDAPAYYQEMVRKLFISSAVSLTTEFHIDGFRLDQTTSIHSYNKIRANGREAGNANIFGAKFLREYGRTLRMFKPDIILIAEDHSEWGQVTAGTEYGGMGFNAKWYSEYYHNLIGDTNNGNANLLRASSVSDSDEDLKMDVFSDLLWHTRFDKVVYNESHDEAGNSEGPLYDPGWDGIEESKRYTSHRTIKVAVNEAPLIDDTRTYAEARCRFAWGVTVLSAGTPMFLFGEEVGAQKRFKYKDVNKNKEDLIQLKETYGGRLYHYYAAINKLRTDHPGLRSRNIDIVHVSNQSRVIVFKRWSNQGENSFLVFASLADHPYLNGYYVYNERIEDAEWKEIFNSDSSDYGGHNIGNFGANIRSRDGHINVIIPFSGVVVFRKIN